jgi:MFS transporter, DHA2 family, multidrug resistance protein
MSPASESYSHKSYASKFDLMMVVLCSMCGVLMQTLDSTIANVSLPYMQGGLSCSRDQITWVLTSYIVAAAIMTAPAGWLASRFGKKNVMVLAMAGFTAASALCGTAVSLSEMVAFRMLQGAFGAALGPLSQSIMLDLYPVEKRGQAMAIWGMGIMLGPILGPTLGGFLTEYYNWRWCFYVNVPVGILATAGMWYFFHDNRRNVALSFDWLGFSVLTLGVGGLQLMLDRGTDQDWFSSGEIITETVLACLGFYLFITHMLTARNPFVPRKLFLDRNFVTSLILMFVVSAVLLAGIALMPPFLQNMAGHPVLSAGLLMGPRGFGVIVAMMLVGRVANYVDPRQIMTVGALLMCGSLYEMAHWTPSVVDASFLTVTIVQGFGMGLVFSPLNLTAFATLSGEMRNSATSLMNLVRNVASAIGVSVTTVVLSNSVQAMHNQLAAQINPFNRALQLNAISLFGNYALPTGAASLDGMVQMRASLHAYENDFLFMFYAALVTLPLIWMLHRPAFSRSGHQGNAVKNAVEVAE